ncbi:MAG TPA: tetratricopeptide repeat protein [Aquifex aeolicus]|nr:tetratricopeptide repeat protein [Aquifex aeolicus]
MLNPTRLCSLFLVLIFYFSAVSFATELQEQLTLRVKVRDIVKVEKPPFYLPDKLSYRIRKVETYNLAGKLFEPPKEWEETELYIPKEGGCGVPKDLNLYREAVRNYKQGNLWTAEEKLKLLVSLPSSPYSNSGKYVLGLIYYKKGKKEEALKLFEESCNTTHMYTIPACESFYALYYQLFKKPYKVDEPILWKYAYLIGASGVIPEEPISNCGRFTFKNYCKYVNDFILGKVNPKYLESTEVRRAMNLFKQGKYGEARKLLLKHKNKFLPYRDAIVYYLGLIALEGGDYEEALDYTLLLETLNPRLAKALYLSIFVKKPELADYVYEKTGDKWVFRYAGIKAYNEGDYKKALEYFIRSGDYIYAVYATLQLGDYQRAYNLLKKVREKDREYYVLLLEILYELGRDEEIEQVLSEVENKYPDIYKEYYGWYMFKKGKWKEAAKYFDYPYFKAIAFFNAGEYERVLEILKEDDSYEARILKAKAAIALGKGGLARRYLFNETPEEIYLTGLSYFIEGNYEKAISYFEKIPKDKKYGLKALIKLADSYYNLGQKDKARALYNLILQKYVDAKEAKEALIGIAQIEAESPSEDLEKVVKEFEKNYPDSPLLPELKLQLAKLYAKEGRQIEAEFILRKLVNNPEYRERSMFLLAQITQNPQEKENILLNLLKSEDKVIREKAFSKLAELYEKENNLLKLARLLENRGDIEKLNAISIYLKLDRIKDAERLFGKLIKKYPNSEELKEIALKLYEKTRKLKYLEIAYNSTNPDIYLKAAYYLGNHYYGKKNRKALNYFLEIVLSDKKDFPFYKRAVFLSVEILKKLGARKDASCILERLKDVKLESWEKEKVLELKKGLPACRG